MNKFIQGLIGLLFIQVIVALAIFWSEQSTTEAPEPVNFVSVSKNAIDKVVIADSEQSVELIKDGEQWQLPKWHGVPVDSNKLSIALNKLIDLKSTWPVTTTANSHERFKVTDENFQRRLTLFSGEQKVGDVFLGSSPGFRKLHIRNVGEDSVYAVTLNSYDFPAELKSWLDKSLLAVSDIQHIEWDERSIEKVDEQWILKAPDIDALLGDAKADAQQEHGGVVLKTEKVTHLVDRFEKLSVTSVAETEAALDFDTATRVTVKNETEYEFLFLELDGKHYVKRSDKDWVFETNGMAEQRLAEFNAEEMLLSSEKIAENEGDESNSDETKLASGSSESSTQ